MPTYRRAFIVLGMSAAIVMDQLSIYWRESRLGRKAKAREETLERSNEKVRRKAGEGDWAGLNRVRVS